MGFIDWAVVAIYALVLIGIGIAASRRQSDTDEYFRGSRTLPWWAIGLSIIATSFSAASLLGGPGQGYQNGFLWLQLQIGDLIGYGLVILIFLPFFIQLNLTTAYEYLERRFDAKTRSLGSLFFLLFIIARLGALLYGASLVVSTVTGLSLTVAILLVGIVSVVYTVAGGIAAVVWTDVLQFGMIFVGLAAGIWAATTGVPGGIGELWSAASEGGKLVVVDPSWDPENILTLPTALIGYGIAAFAVAGTNQQSVQRYASCSDEVSGRKAIFLGWFSGFIGVAATLLLGILLYGFYTKTTATLPADIKPDGILPHFIVNQVPAGAAGLLVSAIFAAAMSSIDSALHSLATCITVDFYDRYSTAPRSEAKSLNVARGLIILWGVIGIASAFYVASTGEDLLPFLVKYTPMFLGPLLGLFLMGVLIPRVNANGAFFGTLGAVAFLAIAVHLAEVEKVSWLTFPPIWRAGIAAPMAIIFGVLISIFGRNPAVGSIRGLTLWTQTPSMPRPGLEE